METLGKMEALLAKYPVAYLMRHAHRYLIPEGSLGNTVRLTPEGEEATKSLAGKFKPYLVDIHTSPVLRCVQTAHFLQLQSKSGKLTQLQHLGSPGVYVDNEEKAGGHFIKWTPQEVASFLINEDKSLPGFRNTNLASINLLTKILSLMGKSPGLYPFISHDFIISVFLCSFLGQKNCKAFWPNYLEGVYIWMEASTIRFSFRQKIHSIRELDGN